MAEDKKRGEDAEARRKRLAEELRANLQRRKGQARARRAGAADERTEGVAVKDRDTRDD